MQILSASEAIGPAWERTREVLLEPFEWRRFLKLSAVATLAALGSSFSFNFSNSLGRHGIPPGFPPAVVAILAALLAVVGMAFFILAIAFFYLGSRMQFVLFEVVATRTSTVGPLWSKYGSVTWRWIRIKLLCLLVIVVVVVATVLPVFLGMARHGGTSQGRMQVMKYILPSVLPGVVFTLLAIALYLLVLDFALPVIALENASFATAMGRVRSLVENYPGDVLLYLLLKILLSIVFAVSGGILIAFTALLSLIPFGITGGILSLLLRHAGPGGRILLVVAALAEAVVFLAWIASLYIVVIGYFYTFWQAFALYFYGGRYPLLGDLLEPPMQMQVALPAMPSPLSPQISSPLPPFSASDEIW